MHFENTTTMDAERPKWRSAAEPRQRSGQANGTRYKEGDGRPEEKS